MTVVVDSSVLVSAVTQLGSEGLWFQRVIRETGDGGSLAGPQIVLTEAGNVLRRLELSSQLSGVEATLALRDLLAFQIDLFPFEPLAPRAWELRHSVTVYDGWYVALAEALGCPLLTLDRRLARAAGPTCRIITP